tara:strand:- start:45074 stop:45817 length:744 start_codon:yes stop_codon:yes gene_type:complete
MDTRILGWLLKYKVSRSLPIDEHGNPVYALEFYGFESDVETPSMYAPEFANHMKSSLGEDSFSPFEKEKWRDTGIYIIRSFMNHLEKIRSRISEHQKVFDILFKRKGVVYGGFIRDAISGDVSDDIDVLVSDLYVQDFYFDLLADGYTESYDAKNGTFNFTKEGELRVEVSECEEDPDKEPLLSTAPADFDVNLLGYNGSLFYNVSNPDYPVHLITKNIDAMETIHISPTVYEERKEKVLKRGYKIK